MVVIDGYTIEQHPNRNQITICLPQTTATMQSTAAPLVQRKEKLTEHELATILILVKQMYKDNSNNT